jgi:hypothetical protein
VWSEGHAGGGDEEIEDGGEQRGHAESERAGDHLV